MANRKTRDEYIIESNYGYGWDLECVCSNYEEYRQNLKDYRENCNCMIRGRKIRVKKAIVGFKFKNGDSVYYFWDYETYNQFLNNLSDVILNVGKDNVVLIYDDENDYVNSNFNRYKIYYKNPNMRIF